MQEKNSPRNIKNDTESFTDYELVAAFIEKRLTDNLAAFKQHLPDIYEMFKEYSEEQYFLIYDQSGNINLFDRLNEKVIYGENPVVECLDNFKKYSSSPIQRPYIIGSGSNELPDEVNYLHNASLSKIAQFQHEALKGLVEEISVSSFFKQEDETLQPSNNRILPQQINLMFIFSVGLGFDIERLSLDYDIRKLIIAEPNPDIFFASMQLVDWAAILDRFLSSGKYIAILINNCQKDLVSDISHVVNSIGRHNVAGAYLYSAFFLESYQEIFKDIKSAISYSYLSGYGFYDDSRYSIAHTMGNIANNVPLLASNRNVAKGFGQSKFPVFIIGNGPSLDDDLEFIASVQDKAVIVSCGTALRPLVMMGIEPDFHVELERTAHVPLWIEQSSKGVDSFSEMIKNTIFIGVSQVHPRTATLFNRSGMMLKDIESGSSLVYKVLKDSGVALIPRLAPSCVHTAISATVLMGYRDFYLFGVDMGTLDPEKHHSKYSAYEQLKDGESDLYKINPKAEVYPSNFGDQEVYSSGFLPMFKRVLEEILTGWNATFEGSLTFNNCSNGAKIIGSEPLSKENIDLDNGLSGFDKKTVVTSVFDAHFSLMPEKSYQKLLSELESVKVKLGDLCDKAIMNIKPLKSIDEAMDLVDYFSIPFHSEDMLPDEDAWMYSLVDGSLLYILSIVNSTAMLPVSEKLRLQVINNQFDELRKLFIGIKEDFDTCALNWDQESRYDMF